MLRRYFFLAVFSAVVSVMASCGGSTAEEAGTTAAPSTTATTTTSTTTTTTEAPTTTQTAAEPTTPLVLVFDDEGCAYEGPEEFPAGPVELSLTNLSDENAWIALNRHTGDETVQDAIDHFGESPSSTECPSWKHDVIRAFVKPGETRSWGADLEPSIYHVVCYLRSPLSVWFGAGLIVEG